MPILGTIASSKLTVAAGDFEMIATTSPTTGTQVDFTSIPSTYKYLQIHFVVFSSSASDFYVRFNNNSGANYGYHYFYGAADGNVVNGTGILSGGIDVGSATAMALTNQFTTGSGTTNPFFGSIYIGDYASTTKKKTLMANFGKIDIPSTQARIENDTSQWNNTAAITQISLFNLGTYATGSQITLYGVKS